MTQPHRWAVFKPTSTNTLSQTERKRAIKSLMFSAEKRDGLIKGWIFASSSTQRSYMLKEEASSLGLSTKLYHWVGWLMHKNIPTL